MRTGNRSISGPAARFGFALSLCLSTSLVACGELPASETSETSSAATGTTPTPPPPTYLVSFASGTIPSNAASILSMAAGSAGATIKASYANLGMVLVQTTATPATFMTNLRAHSLIDAVGPAKKLSAPLELQKGKTIADLKAVATNRPAANPKVTKAAGSDPLSSYQWDMDQIHSPQARAINAGSSSVLVGVLDSGIDITHPDIAGQVDTTKSASCIGGVVDTTQAVWSNDIIGHGTHVSGTIAGKKNGVGIVGVAPGVKLAGVKLAVDDINDPNFGLVFADAMVCAIDWAIKNNFSVMNASLTIDPFTGPIDDVFCTDDPDRNAVILMVRKAVNRAALAKIPLVASTGNMALDLSALTSADGGKCDVLPVGLPRVIGVSSVGPTKLLSYFSDYGQGDVDLAGPGGDLNFLNPNVADKTIPSGQVLSSVPAGSLYYSIAVQWNGQMQDCTTNPCTTYAWLQGTSQAAPHVTGVAALAISRYGRMAPDVLLSKLDHAATPLSCPATPYDPNMTGTPEVCNTFPILLAGRQGNSFYGAGEVDALNIVK